ncbi:MAG: hypothetical protein ABUS48_05280 [Pseudomonadota bacterium]
MRLPNDLRAEWLDMANRLRSMPPSQFWNGKDYDPIRDELAELVWRVEPLNFDQDIHLYEPGGKLKASAEWVEIATPDQLLEMLHLAMAEERWVNGIASEPHKNGFLSRALERSADADLSAEIAS